MPQNIYDNPEFFAGYSELRSRELNANNLIIRPYTRQLIGDPAGVRVLDLGCGAGEMCRWLADKGAAAVTGVDISENMLLEAMSEPLDGVKYMRAAAEDVQFKPGSFDLIVSSLVLHYVEDISALLAKMREWLRPGGRLVFSTEHPITTAGQGIIEPGWILDDDGSRVAWAVTKYSDEGERVSRWFIDGVVRFHRTVSTIVNSVIDAGFRIEQLLEPHVIEEFESRYPHLREARTRPNFLFVAARVAD